MVQCRLAYRHTSSPPAEVLASDRRTGIIFPELTPATARQFIRGLKPVILEIGANDDEDSLKFIRAFPQGQIHCFECDQRAILQWKRRIRGFSNAHLYEAALGDITGQAAFHPSGGNPGGSSIPWDKSGSLLEVDRHCEFQPWLTFLPPITVPVTTLDDWARSRDIVEIDFAWIDVQGAEAKVLRGAKETIRRVRHCYCEINQQPLYKGQPTLKEVHDLLPGFTLERQCAGDNFLFRNQAMATLR